MRMGQRSIHSEVVIGGVGTYEVIEEYKDDKYLPSYLIRAAHKGTVFHVQVATDLEGDNVRIVTAYTPDPGDWDRDFRRRVPR